MNALQRFLSSAVLTATIAVGILPLQAQDSVNVYARGLIRPLGIGIDPANQLWVAEQGSGRDDARISIVTTAGEVFPFLVGLPSDTVEEISGPNHLYFDTNGDLLIVQGEGDASLSESILAVDTAGFVPGDSPLSISALKAVKNIGDFSLANGALNSNPYSLVIGPQNDLFIVDAGLNGIVRWHRSNDSLSVFARFDSIPNPTSVGPPAIDAVPTRIVFFRDHFYVAGFTGFPFLENLSRIYEVDLEGNVAIHVDSLTGAVDLALDPRDSNLVVLEYGTFSFNLLPPAFAPNSGALFEIRSGVPVNLLSGLNQAAGMRFARNGDLYVSSLADSVILKVPATTTSVRNRAEASPPQGFALGHSYPNPFVLGAQASAKTNLSMVIGYQLPRSSEVQITVYDLLGNRVRDLVRAHQAPGHHQVRWDARNESGHTVTPGVYFYTLRAANFKQTRKMLLLP